MTDTFSCWRHRQAILTALVIGLFVGGTAPSIAHAVMKQEGSDTPHFHATPTGYRPTLLL